MAKTKVKTAFFCQSCGTSHSKWQGQCLACKEWNTVVEEVVQKDSPDLWAKKESKKTNNQNPKSTGNHHNNNKYTGNR